MISCPLDSRSRRWLRAGLALPAILLVWGLAACGSDVPIEDKYPIERLPGDSKARYENPSSVFGQGGLFGNSDQGKTGDQGGDRCHDAHRADGETLVEQGNADRGGDPGDGDARERYP